jgi:transcriptional regulator with XRE-family HTH domain
VPKASRDPIDAALGQVVREARLAAGLSQEALAERAGLHRVYVSEVERGQRSPSVAVLRRLAEGLGVSGADLLALAEKAEVVVRAARRPSAT